MKRAILRGLLLIILLLLAVVLGKVIGNLCEGVAFISWLSLSAQFGLQPTIIDLQVIQFTFGAVIDINVAQAILLLAAIVAYSRIKIKE